MKEKKIIHKIAKCPRPAIYMVTWGKKILTACKLHKETVEDLARILNEVIEIAVIAPSNPCFGAGETMEKEGAKKEEPSKH